MRYILISEGFESKDYRGTIEADTPEKALVKLVAQGLNLEGAMLLTCVTDGHDLMHYTWTRAGFRQIKETPCK